MAVPEVPALDSEDGSREIRTGRSPSPRHRAEHCRFVPPEQGYCFFHTRRTGCGTQKETP